MSSINTRPFISEPAETGAIFSLYQRPEWRNVDFGRRFQSNFSLLGVKQCVKKPFLMADLARAVRAELDASRAGKENPGKKFEF